MSNASRRQPLIACDLEAVKRSSTSGTEVRGANLQSLGKAALSSHLAQLSTPEALPTAVLRGRLYPHRPTVTTRNRQNYASALESPQREVTVTRGSTEDLYGGSSPVLEPQSAIVQSDISVVSVGFLGSGDEGCSQWGTPVKVQRRKRVEVKGLQQKDLSTSLIIGGQLQRDEATLLYLKKVAQRKEMQAALSAQIAEKQRRRRIEDILHPSHRHSQPTSIYQTPREGAKHDGVDSYDLSPVLSGSTEDQEIRGHFPDRLSDVDSRQKQHPPRRGTAKPSEFDSEADEQFRRLRYAASISPVRNVFGLDRKATLDERSQFIYPSDSFQDGENTPSVDEIDKFLQQHGSVPFSLAADEGSGREPQSPEIGRFSEQSAGRSFPRHIFGGRTFRKANKRPL